MCVWTAGYIAPLLKELRCSITITIIHFSVTIFLNLVYFYINEKMRNNSAHTLLQRPFLPCLVISVECTNAADVEYLVNCVHINKDGLKAEANFPSLRFTENPWIHLLMTALCLYNFGVIRHVSFSYLQLSK